MHTFNRLITVLCLLVVLVPPATFALINLEEKEQVREELHDAIGSAVQTYQQRSGLQGLKGKGEKTLVEQEKKMQTLGAERRAIRLQMAKARRILASIEAKYEVSIASKEQIASMISVEKRRMSRILKSQYLRQTAFENKNTRDVVLYTVLHAAADHGEAIVSETQEEFLRDLVAAEKTLWKLDTLRQQYDASIAEHQKAQEQYVKAEALIERSEAQLEEIKAITEEVHAQVLKMQSELARIDAKLKAKAERALIEKGLLDPKDAGKTDGRIVKPQFSWPLYGRISAGFFDQSYHKHFGVPHYGVDIPAPQETPVMAAAEGVVFLVRDGGKTGYSYILIGHRGGYATLYGHVFQSLVTAGQEVDVGQAIALSGGTPGTPGAGPMTTGPHLHFEVMQAGVNIDPKTVLP